MIGVKTIIVSSLSLRESATNHVCKCNDDTLGPGSFYTPFVANQMHSCCKERRAAKTCLEFRNWRFLREEGDVLEKNEEESVTLTLGRCHFSSKKGRRKSLRSLLPSSPFCASTTTTMKKMMLELVRPFYSYGHTHTTQRTTNAHTDLDVR